MWYFSINTNPHKYSLPLLRLQEGFSVSGAPSNPFNEAPCTQASPPSAVDVLPASSTSLLVAFEPSADDGGKPVQNYMVEWDAVGLEGYRNGGSPSDSLLYSGVDVQVVEVSATKNDVGGHFTLAYRSVESVQQRYFSGNS